MNTKNSPSLLRVLSLLAAPLAGLALLFSAHSATAQSAAPTVTASPATTTATASADVPMTTTGADADAVANAYRAWLDAVGKAHGNPAPMLKFYAPEAILVATYSPVLLHNSRGELAGYFKKFTALPNLQGTTQDLQTRVYGDWAINTGLYTFTFNTPDGADAVVPARFTYVYRKVDGQWLIVDHHSSLVPPGL
jgi:uncharacterized protein (TIGR02246 family)